MTSVRTISLSHLYESIIENADSNILILDKENYIVAINPGFYWVFLEMYDIHLKRGSKLFDLMDLVVPEVSTRWRNRCNTAMKGLSISDEEEFESGGNHFYWKVYYKSVQVGNEKFVSIFCRNITASKQVHNKILKHEANLRTIINSFSASVLLVNERLDLIDFNNNTFDYFLNTYNVTLQTSKNFIELLPEEIPDLREIWQERLTLALHTKERKSYFDYVNTDHGEVICETRIVPVKKNDAVIGLTISMEDITQKRLEEQLQRTQMNELLKVNAELDKFVHSASHDLRAPLLSVMGVINVMKRDTPQTEIYLSHIEASIRKLDNFVTNITNFSRNNNDAVVTQQIDFNALLDNVVESLNYLDGAKLVSLSKSTTEEVPLFADRSRMTVIFRNILSNAFQYYDPSKKSFLKVAISVNRKNARIEFNDNGLGIRPNLLPRVFEMFFRASENSNGSGLGLYVVKNAVDKLNGDIKIFSTFGLGTRIVIEVPNLTDSLEGIRRN